MVRQLVEAATEKALRPWRRQQEIQKILDDAVPYAIRYTDFQPKALGAAAAAIGNLRPGATREELQFAAKEAIQPFIIQQEHNKLCDRIVSGVVFQLRGETSQERELAEKAVAKALKRLPVGCSQKMLEQVRDRALAPVRKAIVEREKEAEALLRKKQ